MNATQLTTYPIVVGAIIGATEFIKTYVPQVNGGITVLVAVVLGVLAGLYGIEGLNPVMGGFLGLMAVGIHQTASAAGGR